MKNKGPERLRFASVQEAKEHAKVFGKKGTYRFGTDSIVFSPNPGQKIEPQSISQKLAEKKTFDPGMDETKFNRGFHPYYGK